LRTLGVILVVTALGAARYADRQALPPHHIKHVVDRLPGGETSAVLIGRVLDDPVIRSSGTRFLLLTDTLVAAPDTLPMTGRVQVSLRRSFRESSAPFPTIKQGDVVSLRGLLRPPPPQKNPADFDYGHYLRQRGTHATLTLYDSADASVIGNRRTWAERAIAAMRAYVRTQLDRFIPSADARAVLHALVLGDRSGVAGETRNQFARSGLMHLLAISGLHVLFVGMVLYYVLGPFLLRLRLRWRTVEGVRATATIAVLLLYLFIAGASASAARAVIMAGLFIGGVVLQRSSHPLNTLGVAAVVLLLARPGYLFDVGFQLSFAAVASIVTLHPRIHERLPEAWLSKAALRASVAVVTVSVAATLGTIPVLLFHFGRVSFAGLLLNILAIPATALALGGALMTVCLGGWFASAAAVFGAAADILARLLLWTAETGDGVLGRLAVESFVRDPWYLLALTAALLMLAQWPRPRYRWRLAATALCLAAAGVWSGILRGDYSNDLEVIFFDVGHGDATLVSLPNGRYLLIDAGARNRFVDQGAQTLLPHLERLGIRHLDAVVVTHPHNDHLGGLPTLLQAVPIRRVLHNGQPVSSALYTETMLLLDSLAVSHRGVSAGDTLDLDPSVQIQVLAPASPGMLDGDVNNASVVIRLAYGETTFLFTGDAEAEAEQRILAQYGDLLHSDVVKVGHHGSRTSSTPTFVRHVLSGTGRASMAIVSVGRDSDRFGLPNADVLTRWQAEGATVWTTLQEGAVWLRSDGQRISRVRWR
ncbi:MAG: DNA internalization-related competence protein ComEC/Rec2, partial [Rhodothermales bacterium]